MRRLAWSRFLRASPSLLSREFLERSSPQLLAHRSPSDTVFGRSNEFMFSFRRPICRQSTFYGCELHVIEKLPGRSVTSLLSRFFHATGLRCFTERDYYELLGVSQDASTDEIKKAFHALAKMYHPDANKNNPASKRKFQEIRDAYETLRDPAKRTQYDKKFSQGEEEVRYAANDTDNFHESYEDPFARFRRTRHDPFSDSFYKVFSEVFEADREIYAADIEVELNLSFSEAAKGCTKRVSFSAQVPCDTCYGRGYPLNAKPSRCSTCNGSGRVTVFPFTSTCSSCKGSGKIIKESCSACRGLGTVDDVKTVGVTIPAGVDSGDTIHVQKAGNEGGSGAHPGNLKIKLQVSNDPLFARDGADIYVDTHISFTQAILGGTVDVPTLAGKTQVKIPKGVQPDQLLVLRGRGLPKQIGLVNHGDQYVRFRVQFPLSVNERQREILEEFAKEEAMQETSGFLDGNWWHQITDYLNGPRIMLGIAILLWLQLLVGRSLS